MSVTAIKAYFQKLTPKVIHFQKDKSFCNQNFRDELIPEKSNANFDINSLKRFTDVFNNVVNKDVS